MNAPRPPNGGECAAPSQRRARPSASARFPRASQEDESGEAAAIDYIPKIKDRVFSSEDMKEGIQSFVERRSAVFRGEIEIPRGLT